MEKTNTRQKQSDTLFLKKLPVPAEKILMTKVNFEDTFDIYLFTEETGENFSRLSEFISFLKYNRVNLPYKFSYVSRGDNLIPELTLNQNILMDFSPDSLTASKEMQFQDFLKEAHNSSLEKLYHKVALPNELPLHADAQMRKVSALIKALVCEGQFIFLEEPERDLDSESAALFIETLKERVARSRQNVFIFSHDLNLWMPHVNYHVRREKDYSFSIQKIVRDWTWKKGRDDFYKKGVAGEENAGLNFRLPESLKKISEKKTA